MSEEFEYFDLSNDEKEELGSLGDSPHFLLSLGSYHK